MEEGVTYADLRLPPVPAPPQPVRLPWHWAPLSLGVLSLLLLLVQVILVGLSFHYLAHQASCAQGEEKSLSYVQQSLRESCQFCPAGWMGDAGRCYYFSSAKKSWEQSKDDCCSRGAQLATARANSTLAFLTRVAHLDTFHVGLKRDSSRFEWKWLDGTLMRGRLPLQRPSSSFVACGRVSSSGLAAGLCGEALGWVCEKSAVTLQWLPSSIPTFLWGNTTYTCVGP
ncbi:killer cell lectin-like receptor subfamily G member 1 [Aythya fuligula]|uniref:Killer cell lectin-like receptor subfamily G member 1 n=1 Tax=Aythya fuligula TaxID=219594 RepID=A0A6J3EIZ6_AYTFU|nr:killer cell lectin-like receptor subfamily G member 1 [Aythya fuligula]